MNDDKKIEVIWVQPMREAQVIEIDNDLEPMQELVDGYIEEYMPFEDDAAIVCNEEGKVMGLAPNRAIYDQDGHIQEVICGSFFICHAPIDSEEFGSLPENMKKKYMEKFKAPERFFMTAEGIKAVKLDTQKPRNDIRER